MKRPVSTVRWDSKDKAAQLARIARQKGFSSVNRFVNSLAEIVIAQESAEASFRAAASQGDPKRLIALLEKMDKEDAAKGITGTRP